MKRFILAALACAAFSFPAHAAREATSVERRLTVESLANDVAGKTREAYVEALARHAEVLSLNPADGGMQVDRCDFIMRFVDWEAGQYVEGASEDYEACLDGLRTQWADDPHVRVYLFEQKWGDDVRTEGEALLAASGAWPEDLRRRIASGLSIRLDNVDGKRSGELAVIAAELGDGQRVAQAVRHLAARGQTTRAVALLERTPPEAGVWWARSRIRAALALEDREAALEDVRRHASLGLDVPVELASLAHLRAGDVEGARAALSSGSGGPNEADAWFGIAMAERNWGWAATQVDLTDMDAFGENLERYFSLASTSPLALLRPSMWLSNLVLLLMILLLAALPAVLLLPVHYRGAIRRLKGKAVVPLFETVGLRHAWLALAAIIVLPVVAMGIAEPAALEKTLSGNELPGGRTLLRVALWGSLCGLLAFAWTAMRFAKQGGFGWSGAWRSWWRILLAFAAVLAVGYLHGLVYATSGTDTRTAQTEMVDAMVNSGGSNWAALSAFVVIALLVPLWEEFVFRGMLLGGMARHVSFGWANLLQALLFAAIHDDAPRFLYYFALGLLGGWLVRSTRSLAPAILLHMLVNALAFTALLR